MEKLKPFIALLCLLTTVSAQSQIVVGGEQEPDPKKEDKKENLVEMNNGKSREVSGNGSVYFFLSRAYNNRVLTENQGLFGDSIGTRANEEGLKTLCYGLGFRSQVKKSFYLGGGLSIYNNGESYIYEQSDTLFQYNSRYAYVGMPLFLEYNAGETFQFIGTIGITPAMFVRYKQEQNWRNSQNVESDTTIIARNGNLNFNTMVLSGFVAAGFALKMSPSTSFYIKPEYRFQINSSYSKINPFIHKARAFSVNFGFIYNL